MGCKEFIPRFSFLTLAHHWIVGFDGFIVRLYISEAAFLPVSGGPWMNYQRPLMRLTRVRCEGSMIKAGNLRTDSSNALRSLHARFLSKSLQSFSRLISK